MAYAVDDMHEDVKDIRQILAKTARRSAMPDTVIRQGIPLKPEIFHGRDGLVEEIARSLMKAETSRVCILGPGGMGKTSVLLAVVELH
jgi:Cdc6-like AAA superfamily ATPase